VAEPQAEEHHEREQNHQQQHEPPNPDRNLSKHRSHLPLVLTSINGRNTLRNITMVSFIGCGDRAPAADLEPLRADGLATSLAVLVLAVPSRRRARSGRWRSARGCNLRIDPLARGVSFPTACPTAPSSSRRPASSRGQRLLTLEDLEERVRLGRGEYDALMSAWPKRGF